MVAKLSFSRLILSTNTISFRKCYAEILARDWPKVAPSWQLLLSE